MYSGSYYYDIPTLPLLSPDNNGSAVVKVILYIRMLFREGELGSPSSRRLARRGADGEAWGLETLTEGRPDRSNLTPAFPPRDLGVRNIGLVQNCEGGKRKEKNDDKSWDKL